MDKKMSSLNTLGVLLRLMFAVL